MRVNDATGVEKELSLSLSKILRDASVASVQASLANAVPLLFTVPKLQCRSLILSMVSLSVKGICCFLI